MLQLRTPLGDSGTMLREAPSRLFGPAVYADAVMWQRGKALARIIATD